jgi:F1F0 ATPase subunit 2
MSDALHYFLVLVAGFGLGLGFFGGLWWTVLRVTRGQSATWLFPLSSLVRTALLLAGFWSFARGNPMQLAPCLAGWLIARQFIIRRYGPAPTKGNTVCT